MTEPGDGLDDTLVRPGAEGSEAAPDTLGVDDVDETVVPAGPRRGAHPLDADAVDDPEIPAGSGGGADPLGALDPTITPAHPPSGVAIRVPADAPAAVHDTLSPSGTPAGLAVVGHEDTFVRSGAELPAATSVRDLHVTDEHSGRYSGEREVGRGGLGRVAATYDRHLARQVAKKELLTAEQEAAKSGSGSQSQAVARFLREARVTAQLEHPNIVPVYELGRKDGGELYYTMKLVRGRTLKAAIAAADDMQDRLTLLSHFVDLCQAIAYAHSRGVIHRDIKPDNVMIGEFGETLVLDWGVAKLRGSEDLRGEELARAVARLRDEEGAQTLPGSAFGTPVYMAPEQADGRIEDVDERSDVWALGVVLYQLLSGRIPYPNTHVFAVLVRAARAELVPLEDVCDDAPPELAAVVARALAADPEDRYDSAKALAEDIEAFRAGGRVEAYRYSTKEVLLRFLAEHRAAVTVSGIAALVLMLVLAGAYLGLREERDRARAAEQDSRAHFAAALVERARVHERSHDWVGAELLAADALVQSEQPEARGLLIAAQAGLRPELMWSERTYAGCADIAYAPEAEALFCGTSFGVARFDAATGAQTARLETKGGWVRAVAVSAGGDRLLAGGDGAQGLLYALEGADSPMQVRLQSPVLAASFLRGVPTVVTERGAVVRLVTSGGELEAEVLHEGGVDVALAAAGPGAVVFADRDGKVVRFDVSGALAFTPPHGGPLTALAVSDDGRRIATAGDDRVVRLFDATGGPLGVVRDRGLSVVTSLAFAGRALIAGSDEGEVHVLDPRGRRVRARFVAHEGPVDRVLPVAGGVMSAGRDRRVRRYRGDLPAATRVALDRRLVSEARGVALAADGGEVALAGPWGLRLLTADGPQEISETRFEAVALSTDGRWLAAGGSAGGISWRVRGAQGAQWTDVEPIAAPIAALAFEAGAGRLFAVGRGGALVRVDLESRRATVAKARLGRAPTALAVGTTRLAVAEGPRITLASTDGEAQGSLPEAESDVSALAIAEAAGLLAAGDADGAISLWSLAERRLRARFSALPGGVRALAFTEGGALLALGADGAVAVYDLASLDASPRELQRSLRALRGVRLDGLRPVPR